MLYNAIKFYNNTLNTFIVHDYFYYDLSLFNWSINFSSRVFVSLSKSDFAVVKY